MVDIRLTGFSVLAFMCLGTKQIGIINLPHLLFIHIIFNNLTKIRNQKPGGVLI